MTGLDSLEPSSSTATTRSREVPQSLPMSRRLRSKVLAWPRLSNEVGLHRQGRSWPAKRNIQLAQQLKLADFSR